MTIFKMQLPLFEADGDILAYNQDRSITMLLKQSKELSAFFGSRHKIFVEAEVADDKLNVHKLIPDRGW